MKKESTFACLFLTCNLRVEIAIICVVHYNTETLLVHEGLLVGDDVRVAHGFEHVDLIS